MALSQIADLVTTNRVVLVMKGTRRMPQCEVLCPGRADPRRAPAELRNGRRDLFS